MLIYDGTLKLICLRQTRFVALSTFSHLLIITVSGKSDGRNDKKVQVKLFRITCAIFSRTTGKTWTRTERAFIEKRIARKTAQINHFRRKTEEPVLMTVYTRQDIIFYRHKAKYLQHATRYGADEYYILFSNLCIRNGAILPTVCASSFK